MEDAKIIGLLFSRDERGLGEIRSKYGKMMTKIAEEITSSPEDAEEIVDDALLGVWGAIPPELPASLPAYLVTVTRNKAVSRQRANASRGIDRFAPLDELADWLPSAEEMSDSREILHAIEVFLGTLDEKGRIIFVRRYWGCESVKAIAGAVGMSSVAVGVRLSRMREKLAETLKKEGIEL